MMAYDNNCLLATMVCLMHIYILITNHSLTLEHGAAEIWNQNQRQNDMLSYKNQPMVQMIMQIFHEYISY